MISKKAFQEVIDQYPLDKTGHKRESYLNRLIPAIQRKEIIILKGVRRCGKTTLMKQMIKHLTKEGTKKENILYVNFDDYNFLPHLSIKLLELMLSTRNFKEKQYLFLDEIQKVPQFESWLRTQHDRELNVKFVISGSNSTLLAKDLATLLTGRNLTFEVYPLTYNEFRQFTKTDDLNKYLEFGGFPEIVLEEDYENKLNLLRNYISDIINKDIILRKDVKDQKQLTLFAQYILQNPGLRLSINKLSKQTNLSKDTVKKYINYMIDAYIIFEVPFFSYSAKSKFIPSNIPKYYVIDTGFYKVNIPKVEKGKLYENLVAQELYRKCKELFYWKGTNEVDFVSEKKAYNVVGTEKIPEREFKGIEEIQKKHKHVKKLHVIYLGDDKEKDNISFVSIKTFLDS